jgi:glucose/arabinose dehydrogenase
VLQVVVFCAAVATILLFGTASAPRAGATAARAGAFSATVRVGTLPTGFRVELAFWGLTQPTAIRFSPDGRVFVAEKSGLIKVFDSITDTTPTVFADLRTNVHNFWDRGLLGLALDPQFPTKPYVYVLYTYDAPIGGVAPTWGKPGQTSDGCPTPPGPTTDGCVVSGRLSRLTANGDVMTGTEKVLINDWCQQFPSHSIGSINFGADGALYVSGGEGANFDVTDYGQMGSPLNPCGDPPGPPGTQLTPPAAEGGSLRAQDLRTNGDPVGLDGSILRVDPATGDALPDNPMAGNADPNARRIIAYGVRNPFRFTIRPGTNEVWLGDVGSFTWEEIDRIPNPTDGTVENFGWPCYEGPGINPDFDSANLNICENLYAQAGAVTPPYFTYNHADSVVPGDGCSVGSSATAGVAFETGTEYPAAYDGALFFADYARSCIWAMLKGPNGLPDPSNIVSFESPAWHPVDVEFSPAGELYYVDLQDGEIHRIRYFAGDQPPVAVATATPTNGNAPLSVQFDASGSSDPDPGDPITYAWDLDGDGQYDDSTLVNPTHTYGPGTVTIGLKVTDSFGMSSTTTVQIQADNTPPVVTIASPLPTRTWKVGDVIPFSGSATDQQDGTEPASAFSWSLIMHHCPSNCHTHFLQQFDGVRRGSFAAPDHEYPSWMELDLTVTDKGGLQTTQSVLLYPKTVDLSFKSVPSGLQLVVGSTVGTTPFTKTVILGSKNTISATSPQPFGGGTYAFTGWSDGGVQTHDVVASNALKTYTASYDATSCPGLFLGQYYASIDLSGTPAFARCDPAVSFGWGLGGPRPGLVDNFSARWTSTQDLAAGTYRFKARVDDGVRVWVDGALVIDEWHDVTTPTTYQSAKLPLEAGPHDVKMEYYEHTGTAAARLWWVTV